jgi:GT2 family glycosyltransferase
MTCPASIVIPTRGRPSYLEVALASIAPQAADVGAEVLVVDDAGPSAESRALAARFGARYEAHPRPLGLNVARNTGVQRTTGDLVVFVDDDVRAGPGWLQALIEAARANPRAEVFAGPIRPRLEGRAPRGCGREALITALDLGSTDADAPHAWGANMAIRRGALERIGPFDASLEQGGDEQEWQERHRRAGGAPARYVAAAGVHHRRAGADARLRSLARGAYARGRGARRFDAHRGLGPSLARELLTLAGCVGHVARRRCPAGLTQAAHSAARVREAAREAALGSPARRERAPARPDGAGSVVSAPGPHEQVDDFLSGASGTVGGLDALRRGVRDAAHEGWDLASGRRLRITLAARRYPPRRRVLVLGVQRPERHRAAARAYAELRRSRHTVELHTREPDGRGKFENLNLLLGAHPPEGSDWLLVIDDDVALPRGFLDRLLFLCERFQLQLAQPAHRLNSHAAWLQTRRRPRSVVRETAFVEIGPVTAFAAATFSTLLPFPELRMGWGLDVYWAALARSHGWRCGVVDAVTIRHRTAPAGAAYSRAQAIEEARAFLAERPYLSATEAQRTLTTHRRW